MAKSQHSKKKVDVYSIITDRIIQQLEKGIIPWNKMWGDQGTPKNLISKKEYKALNAMMLGSYGYENPYFLTANQCIKLGGQIKRGETGMKVLSYFIKYRNSDGEYFEAEELTSEQIMDCSKLYNARYFTVFNVEQCEGIERHVPKLKRSKLSNPNKNAESIIKGYTEKERLEIRYGGNQAFYSPSEDYIMMPNPTDFMSKDCFYNVLFHELIHSTGHKKRLNRKGIVDNTTDYKYSFEELVAELGSCFLINSSGFIDESIIQNSASYIQSWIVKLKDDPKMIVLASSVAAKACDYILKRRKKSVMNKIMDGFKTLSLKRKRVRV